MADEVRLRPVVIEGLHSLETEFIEQDLLSMNLVLALAWSL